MYYLSYGVGFPTFCSKYFLYLSLFSLKLGSFDIFFLKKYFFLHIDKLVFPLKNKEKLIIKVFYIMFD